MYLAGAEEQDGDKDERAALCRARQESQPDWGGRGEAVGPGVANFGHFPKSTQNFHILPSRDRKSK